MADPTKRGFRSKGTTSQPMTVVAGGDGTPLSSFGYDDTTIFCTAMGAGGEGQVQLCPWESGTAWVDYGSPMTAAGEYVSIAQPSYRVRVQQKAATTGSYQIVQEVR